MPIECPNCGFEILENEEQCPECGNPITAEDIKQQKTDFAYSRFADIALVIGQVPCFMAALAFLFMIPASLIKANWLDGILYYPCAFFIAVALQVVFARARTPKKIIKLQKIK